VRITEAMAGVKALTGEQRIAIGAKVDALLKIIEEAPKSGRWKSRAKIGTSKQWFKEVADWA
jgi:hypothetical protein